ncbi:hypothetical protein [Plantibacter sp. YIM 135249]|uniref:hypothetical protein n=1 Tax=Plantibacter sp. YIM 135249 TaxID=3423918 RepID=UPI003D345590
MRLDGFESSGGTSERKRASRRFVGALVTALVGGLALASIGLSASSEPVHASVAAAACVQDVAPGTTCGELTVPETRGVDGSKPIRVPYLVVPAGAGSSEPPLVVLTDDVPFASIDVRRMTETLQLSADRDVVFVERRGGASAKPSLRCPAAVDALEGLLAKPKPRETASTGMRDAVGSCVKEWREAGVDPAAFGVEQSAHDLVDLRHELGYSSWFLAASGVSAPVAARAAAIDESGVVGVVLDSPAFDARLTAGFAATADRLDRLDTRAGDRVGEAGAGSADHLESSMKALTRDPHRVPGWRPIVLDGDTLELVVDAALDDPARQAALPLGLSALAGGDPRALDAIVQPTVTELLQTDLVAHWLASCSAPFTVPPPDEARPGLLDDFASATCEAAGVAQSAQPDPAAIHFTQRALVVSAPEGAAGASQTISETLPGSTVVEFAGAGAPIIDRSACAVVVLRAWLADPEGYRAGLCAADDAAVPVVSASAAAPVPMLASALGDGVGRTALIFLVPILYGVVSIVWAIAWLLPTVAAALRGSPVQDRLATGIAPIFGSIWFIATSWTLLAGWAASPATMLLGVPAAVPWLSVLLVVSLAGLSPVWQRAGRGRRLSVVAASALGAATAVWTAAFVFGWA